uniref:Uncharacterized protein n=1 Tax=Acrobeloides nanus TaxID=290746 RepID=A0A914D8I5_9BILA
MTTKEGSNSGEIIFLTQNITNLVCLVVFLCPFLAFEYIYGNATFREGDLTRISPNVEYIDSWLYQGIRFFYETYCARVIWRSVDELLSAFIQFRLIKMNK